MKTHTPHTPGPWRVAPTSDYASGVNVAAGSHSFIALFGERGNPQVEADAERAVACVNACEGIADPGAAPELLAAMKWLFDKLDNRNGKLTFDGVADSDEWQAQARAAIARATGEKEGK